jgi:uncharacterized membrane protein
MLARLARHWWHGDRTVRRHFPGDALDRIEAAIEAGEGGHGGEICVAIEAALPPSAVWSRVTPRERALEVFSQLRVWDTEQNCGVLVYLLLADRDAEIVADRGIHRVAGEAKWAEIAAAMEVHFRAGRFADGVIAGVSEINVVLARNFVRETGDRNELSNRPVILR